jgi:CHAT domain-containing protein
MPICAFCRGPMADDECSTCGFARETLPVVLFVNPDRDSRAGQLFIGAGTPPELRTYTGAMVRASPMAVVVCLADPSRSPRFKSDGEPPSLVTMRDPGAERVWYAISSTIAAAAPGPGLIINEVALRGLTLTLPPTAQRFGVDVGDGRFSLVYMPSSALEEWLSESDDAAPRLLALDSPRDPVVWRDRRDLISYVDDEMFDDDDEDGDADDLVARSGTVEEPAPSEIRAELSPWDEPTIARALDPSEQLTLVAPVANISAAAVPPPVREHRFLHAQCPENVAIGSEFAITCAIRLAAGARETSFSLAPFEVPYDGATVFVAIYVDEGLEVSAGGWVARTLYPGLDSDEIEFRVRVTSEVPRWSRVTLLVQVDGRCVGSTNTRVRIGPATSPARPIAPLPLLPRRIEVGDVLITIVHEFIGGIRRLRFHWQDEHVRALPDMIVNVDGDRAEVLTEARRELWRLTHQRPAASALETRQRLRMVGRQLWALLLPPQVQTLLTMQRESIKRIVLFTDDTAIPWELLHSPKDDREPEFLVETVPLTRWPLGTQLVPTLRADVARIAVPANAPPAATAEAQLIRDIISRKGQSDAITDFGRLMAAVEAGEFHILHLACHDLYEAGQVNFGGVLFGVNLLHSATLAQNPLVFANLGRTTPVAESAFVISQKWARGLIERRAGAFVGPQWCVPTDSATAFARAFYDPVIDGVTLGEAARQARCAIRDRPGDSTWLAYAVYGDPLASIS